MTPVDLLLWRAMVVAAQTRRTSYPPIRWQVRIRLLRAALRRIMAIPAAGARTVSRRDIGMARKRETRT
jgi:hypothetical protein